MNGILAKTALVALLITVGGTMAAEPVHAGPSKEEKARKKFEKRFKEVVQPIQYDGEYSPPVGRPAEPAPSATVPVRYIPPYMREIPVIVPPQPVYVTAEEFQQQEQTRAQEQQQRAAQRAQATSSNNRQQTPGTGAQRLQGQTSTQQGPADNGAAPGQDTPGQVYEGEGSVTGSDTYADFSRPLPQ